MHDALTITLKDLRLLARDRRALVILIALPMVIIAIVGSSTGRLRNDREQRRLGLNIEVADFDQSNTSRRLSGFLAAFENVMIIRIPEESGATVANEQQMEELKTPAHHVST